MMASQLRKDSQDEKKKLMLSRLSPKAGKSFDLLAARNWNHKDVRDWNHEDPRMSKSKKYVISD
jgi:hypothetical protein